MQTDRVCQRRRIPWIWLGVALLLLLTLVVLVLVILLLPPTPPPAPAPGATGATGNTGSMGSMGSTGVGSPGATGVAGSPVGDVCALPGVDQIVYVNKGGSDISGNGSLCAPYLTITFAVNSVSDASPDLRYGFEIGPGTYNENVHLPANMFLLGGSVILVRIGSVDVAHPSWSVDGDHRSGLVHLQVLGDTGLDWVTVQSAQGKMYVYSSRLSGDVDMLGCNSINQLILSAVELQSSLFLQGGEVAWYSSTIFGNVEIHDQNSAVNPVPGQFIDTVFLGSGGGFIPGNNMLVLNDIPSALAHNIFVYLSSFGTNGVTLTVMGDGSIGDTVVYATADSIPQLPSITNGATLNLLTYALAIGYDPLNLTAWSGVSPGTVQIALDRIAALIGPIPVNGILMPPGDCVGVACIPSEVEPPP